MFPGSAGVCHWGSLAIAVVQEPGSTSVGLSVGALRSCAGSPELRAADGFRDGTVERVWR